MINLILDYYKNISDSDLRLAITEIRESEETGIIGDIVRNHTSSVREITGSYVSLDLSMVQIGLMKEASFRWIKS
jgi:hypothetical protein